MVTEKGTETVVKKTRYTDAELGEFRAIIEGKIEKHQKEYDSLLVDLKGNPNDTNDTCPTFKVLEEGRSALSKEENGFLLQRKKRIIEKLYLALVRIKNKTYGICRETGDLIPKERLLLVPHATLCKEAKDAEKDKGNR